MARPDLAPGYDGWQALDPTPQEKSEGTVCTGGLLLSPQHRRVSPCHDSVLSLWHPNPGR